MKQDSEYVFGKQIELPMLIHVSRVRSHVASRVTWHSHKGYEILCLTEGATAYEFSGLPKVELRGGQFLVVPPGLVHRGLADMRAPCTICGLALTTHPRGWRNTTFARRNIRRLHCALEASGLKPHPFNSDMRWLVPRLMEATGTFAQDPRRPEGGVLLRSLICELLVQCMCQILVPVSEPKVFVSAAQQYLREHLQDRITVGDLVRFVGFGRARLFDIFKAQTGLTPIDYLQRLRVEKAQEYLRSTNKSVTEIALSTGFSSGQYFSTVFARYTGVSPTQFRNGAKARRLTLPHTGDSGLTIEHNQTVGRA